MIPVNTAIANNWVTILFERGYVGTGRERIEKEYDQLFSKEGWAKAHYLEGEIIPIESAIELYEDAYFDFLHNEPLVLDWLVSTASNVYDLDPSNIESGTDYLSQECTATHLQDIAVRRVLDRLGKKFEGDHLVQIRGHTSEGYVLNPGKVPFHKPELILPNERRTWWDKGSVEDFYQSNKVLVVDPQRLRLGRDILCPDGTMIYKDERSKSYVVSDDPRILNRVDGKALRRLSHIDKTYIQFHHEELIPYSSLL